jgi:hypothetical protein
VTRTWWRELGRFFAISLPASLIVGVVFVACLAWSDAHR